MDFYRISERTPRSSVLEIYPDFRVARSKDLMVRGGAFYAIWDAGRQVWSTDEADVQRLVDEDLEKHAAERRKTFDGTVRLRRMSSFSSRSWSGYRAFVSQMFDNARQLDERLTFSNTKTKRSDYSSKRLPYPLEEGPAAAYGELMGALYDPEERAKLEWAVGAVVAGDARNLQKFVALYGESGTGKSTFLNIVQKLFPGYYTTFEAKALANSSNTFAADAFRGNPLVAIQHDADLSRIEDNTKLNSLIAHEEMTMNEKNKPSYTFRSNAFLFLGTNKPVKITDAKSGLIRRLIDVKPSGRKVPPRRYEELVAQIDFELGGVAWHCLKEYRRMGAGYFANYRPLEMLYQTDSFFNFVESGWQVFAEQDGASLSQAYEMYKEYCDESLAQYRLARHKFREELKSYFEEFCDVTRVDGKQVRSYYRGFIKDRFRSAVGTAAEDDGKEVPLMLGESKSQLDALWADCPAQYAGANGTPLAKWADVATRLSDIDTSRLHYVKPPPGHIVIDFDLKDGSGEKSQGLNLLAAAKFPPTYAERSKGGKGIHLHYVYGGDSQELAPLHSEGIEVLTFAGQSCLRRKLTCCNDAPVAAISGGLPLKPREPSSPKGAKMLNFDAVHGEKKLRELIARNLRKEIHPGTKPSVDFISKLLEEAYESGMKYDVTDLRPKILVFANNSSNRAAYCVKAVQKMRFASEEPSAPAKDGGSGELVFFDVEVFPNLFVLCWKAAGKKSVVRMLNPSAAELEDVLKFRLVGFNCRRYDNHILYARYVGYDIRRLYELSRRIVGGSANCFFGEAYNISYTDVYDFSAKKQSLKKFQIELGLNHQELGMKWDEEVPEDKWRKVADYCANDVEALEAVFEARRQDFVARQILADLSGLTPNDTTQQHTARIIFGDDRRPQEKFVYTDLGGMFPGYKYENGKSAYRGEETGEGGYVYAEPGMYADVAVLDVASMHPTSLVLLDMFGPYTKAFKGLIDARLAIKHRDYDAARKMLGGTLAKHLGSEDDSKALSYALKIVINIVYGLTSAKFDNKFRDPRNKDNIVAKRGALFMLDLKHAVQERGYTVAHIKTDSIKIPGADRDIIDFVSEFGRKYGYEFEHEETYDKFCLVNNAVYIARRRTCKCVGKCACGSFCKGGWTATGAQFAHPYVFKTLFSNEPVEFADMVETKSVTTALYLDFDERLLSDEERDCRFVGKVGAFCPVRDGCGGGLLLREKDGKHYAATGSKGYRWKEAHILRELGLEDEIDRGYFDAIVEKAREDISKFGSFDWLVSDSRDAPAPPEALGDAPPWEHSEAELPECSNYWNGETSPVCCSEE